MKVQVKVKNQVKVLSNDSLDELNARIRQYLATLLKKRVEAGTSGGTNSV